MKKIIIIILSLLLLIVTIANIQTTLAIRHQKKTTLKVVEYQHVSYDLEEFKCDLSRKEIKRILDAFAGVSYKYVEVDDIWSDDEYATAGTADIKNKTITIVNWLPREQYAVVLAHELTHLKYKAHNETFTEYKAITWLYETNIKAFQIASLNRAKTIIRGDYAGTEYDCGYYLLKYFKGVLNGDTE